jgi:hypothetical protein
MRTKALLCAAALAAGACTAMAQGNVYSLNVVGYVNTTLPEGFSLVGNPLSGDGTGSNDLISVVISNQLPLNTTVYAYNGVGYNVSSYAKNKTTGLTNWTPDGPLNPGNGVWIRTPAGSGTKTNTFVGNVLQGQDHNPNIPAGGGFALLSPMAPVAGGLTTALNYQPILNDTVYKYNGVGYDVSSYAKNKTTGLTNWTPSEPSIAVGQGFWLKTSAGSVWNQNFTVP